MKRLRELRRLNHISMKELGSAMGVSESTISLYETNKRQPDKEMLIKLSNYFDVSTDYLLELSDIKKGPTTSNGDELEKILQDPIYKAIYDRLMQLNPENLQMALSVIEGMINHQDKKEDH